MTIQVGRGWKETYLLRSGDAISHLDQCSDSCIDDLFEASYVSGNWFHYETVIEDKWECIVRTSCLSPRFLLVFLHGFSSNPYELVELMQHHAHLFHGLPVALVGPRGGLHLGGPSTMHGSFCWWRLLSLVDCRTTSSGVAWASRDLHSLVASTARHFDIPYHCIALQGFSQGAQMALDLFFSMPEEALALAVHSGFPLHRNRLRRACKRRQRNGAPLFVSHGNRDAVVPLAAGQRTSNLLRSTGHGASWFVKFHGGHWLLPVHIAAAFSLAADRMREVFSLQEAGVLTAARFAESNLAAIAAVKWPNLAIRILEARNLSDPLLRESTPRVRVRIGWRGQLLHTAEVESRNPKWGETFLVPWNPFRPEQSLQVSVWNRVPGRRQSFLSSLTIRLDQLKPDGKAVDGWWALHDDSGSLRLALFVMARELRSPLDSTPGRDCLLKSPEVRKSAPRRRLSKVKLWELISDSIQRTKP
ncbi:MAG: uncharacterized protein KVP18_000889 [Porospora cf. gigantea A]|uniref:uncharacterized protein n=1 Tax=Porospora cf. gigantea A TaxID=2853593 RepID=UPI003559CE5A|nr:MAG: hypothetical protein KVP18_000889 [Porospora cf. gigantea A]